MLKLSNLPRRLLLTTLAAALVALVAFQTIHLPAALSAPAPASINLPTSDDCSGSTASMDFSWTGVTGASQNWLDLSLQDNGFADGTFVGAGPLSGDANSYVWSGLTIGLPHFWRLNALTDAGWVTSATGVFVPCGYPQLLSSPSSCDSDTSATVSFNWAPMGYSVSTQYLDLSSDSGFSSGNTASVGLTPTTHSYTWSSIPANTLYYYRVNELAGDGNWYATETGSFSARCGPQQQINPNIYASSDTLVISRLGIDAPVNVRDVDYDGVLGDPAGKDDVVRYNFGAFPGYGGYPGNGGTTLLAGHVDYHPNFEAVFWYLRDVVPGDEIDYYRGDGSVISYSVNWSGEYPPDGDFTSLALSTNPESMVLITCDGVFNPDTHQYDHRFVVEATRIN